jgi:hypothetical protein
MPVIKFYPTDDVVGGFAPAPVPALTEMPEWFRKLPPYQGGNKEIVKGADTEDPHGGHFLNTTAKKCMAMIDTFTTGYYFLCPADIYFDTTDEDNIEMKWKSAQYTFVLTHTEEQTGAYPLDDSFCKQGFRWAPYWMATTPPGYSTLFTQPFHRLDLPFVTTPGIIDTDGMPSAGALPFNIKKGFKGIIKRGTPIAQAIPFKRDDWEHEVVDHRPQDVMDRLSLVNSTFTGSYKDHMWERKSYK